MTSPVLACGACLDASILRGAPFFLYWTVVFLIWALPFGIPFAVYAKRRGVKLAIHPLRYLIYAVVTVVAFIPLAMGAVLGPMSLFMVVWLLQLWWSPWWLARYRFGPLEWLWRSLTYRRRQPFRREAV